MAKKNLTIGIIGGKGKMGAVFAKFFEQGGYKVLISDRRTKLKNSDVAKKSDVVIVSVPIDKTEEVISEIHKHLKPSQLLMDLTSVKEMPVRAMKKSKAAVIGLHPMCNDTTFGPGQKLIICAARPKKWRKWVKEVFGDKGGLILHELSPRKHDEIMSMVQGLVHFAEFVFGKTLKEQGMKVEDLLPFASPASGLKIEIASRLLSQDPNLYGNIQISNKKTAEVTSKLIESATELHGIISKKDLQGFKKYFNEASKFLGDYRYKAQKESDWIINQWLEKFQEKPKTEQKKCSQKEVAVLGPENSYSSFAAQEMLSKFKIKKELYYMPTIESVIDAVAKKKVFAGIVPIENILQGTIRETLDGLFKKNIKIVAQYKKEIHHCIAVLKKGSKIESINSHHQALAQCSSYIKKNHKKTNLVQQPSTSAAFEYISRMKLDDVAVIGPLKTAKKLGFHIIEENIENNEGNKTTFLLITHAKTKLAPTKPKKVSIAFHFSKDSAGSLHGVLGDFREAGINLTKLESRPATHSLGDYVFFVDYEGTLKSSEKTLKAIKKKVAKLKVLGEY